MRKLITILSLALLGTSTTAMAVPVTTTGVADTLASAGNISPSEQSEKDFLATLLGVDSSTLDYSKYDFNSFQQVTGGPADTDLWGFDFGSYAPAAFMIKTGANVCLVTATSFASACPTTYNAFGYINNTASLSWGVIDLNLFDRTKGEVEIGMVSHISRGGGTSVPEPGTLALLGAGLLGLGMARRRKTSA